MFNILIAVGAGLVSTAVLALPKLLTWAEASLPGVIVLVAVYFVVARRTFKKVEAIFEEAGKCMTSMPPKIDMAVTTMEKAYAYGRWQVGVASQVDAQIGIIRFLEQDFASALPYLKRALGFSYWLAAGMLAVIHYKKKDHAAMREALDIATKRGKSQPLAWCLAAYLLQQIGDRDAAQKILAQGVKATKEDARVKEALLAVQNDKKIKMRAFKEQWFQFHLERPPAQQMAQYMPGMRVSKAALRGR